MSNATGEDAKDVVTIVLRIPKSLYDRAKPYFFKDKLKEFFFIDSAVKRVAYLESRDKLFQRQRILSDANYMKTLQDKIDRGEI